jgi:hypothetical protein
MTVPSYNSSARTARKTPSSFVKNACLSVRYLAMDVLLLLSPCTMGIWLLTTYLAVGIHVTLIYIFHNRSKLMHITTFYKSYQLTEAEEYSY